MVNKNMRKRDNGAALITAIVFSAIFATLMAGVVVYAYGHYSLAVRESDNAAAIQLADAGINYELRYISQNQFQAGFVVHGSANPDTGSVTGVPGTFTVWVTKNDGSAWNTTSGNDMLMWATGTVNGITRKIQAQGQHGDGLFDNYAVYGTNSVTFNGSGSSVIGSVGTNGSVSSSSSGSGAVTGTIALNGPGASGVTGSNVTTNPDPIYWPTVDQIITNTFPGPPSGWTWLASHNNNANARTYVDSKASFPSTALNSTTTQISAATTQVKMSNGVLILPPGDYYFTSIDLHGTSQLIVDNQGLSTSGVGSTGTPGLVRIWLNGSGGDVISNPFSYTSASADPAMFRFYDNSPGSFQIDGNTASGGGFYSVTAAGDGGFTITGGSFTYGAVIANNITISGNSTVEFPSGTTGNSSDTSWLWFGIKGGWKEVPGGSGVTFSDGTSS